MTEKKQTAIDYLYGMVVRKVGSTPELVQAYHRAKEMECIQIIDACSVAFTDGCAYISDHKTKFDSAQQYYSETYYSE